MRIASSLLTATLGALVSAFGATAMAAPPSGSALLQPTWDLPTDTAAAVHAAGLPLLDKMSTTYHYHAHLDVIVFGQPVVVPALIGIDDARRLGSPMHTHDATGIVHLESAEDIPFTLGQFCTEWGQPLTADQVGPIHLTPFEAVQLYVNGVRFPGDPASYRFAPYDEIALVVGTRSMNPVVPTHYDFPPDLSQH
ncbi:hypothetical protein ACQP0C_12550 [Nocardia sp. CA-129566]|uniref:hypothetical protein n=1 Tax=Nocardia sp. CA-129566 TaxID=3239976 RepID=UPI003D955628